MITAERAHLHVAAASHPGMSGKNNEDRYGISAFYMSPDGTRPAVLAVVADGIGGHRAGEIAAELAVETINRVVAESDGQDPAQILQEAVIAASHVVYEKSETDPALHGMGTTCVCAWVIEDRLYTASVGDSRIYLVRGGGIHQLTTDHTWVQEAIENGLISPEQARNHPNAHVIRRYLGSRQKVVPDLRLHLRSAESDAHAEANQGARLLPGDILLLCSDGLTDLVDSEEILAEVKAHGAEQSLDELVRLANERGGHDNITVITLRVPDEASAAVTQPVLVPDTVRAPLRRLSFGLSCSVFFGLLLVGLLALGGLYWYVNRTGGGTAPTSTSIPAIRSSPASVSPSSPTSQPGILPSPSLSPFSPLASTTTPSQRLVSTPRSGPTLTPWPTNTLSPP